MIKVNKLLIHRGGHVGQTDSCMHRNYSGFKYGIGTLFDAEK